MIGTTRRLLSVGAVALTLALIGAQISQAAPVSFTNIVTATQTPGDPANMYGVPDLSTPDELNFPGLTGFASSSIGSGGSDITGGISSFTVTAPAGTWVTGFHWDEFGSWTIDENPPASNIVTNATNVRNRINGFITIEEVGGSPVALAPVAVSAPALDFFGINDTNWSNGFDLDLTPYGQVTKFSVAITNRLLSFSEGSVAGTTVASIDKQRIEVSVDTAVPEPTSAALALMLGLAAPLLRKRS